MVEHYEPVKNDSLRVGIGENDFLPYIQKGYTLMLPENKQIKGVLIFLEDSKYDQKNRSSKQMYTQASEKGFAVLSVSTEIPLDFYFSKSSMLFTHKLIQKVFHQHHIPNDNIFFLGTSLVGHRAMRYIKFMKERNLEELQVVNLKSFFNGVLRKAENFKVIGYDIPKSCCATYFPEANVLVPLDSFAHTAKTPASKSVIISIEAL